MMKPNKSKILIVGASSDIGCRLVAELKNYNVRLGLHYRSNPRAIQEVLGQNPTCRFKILQADLAKPGFESELLKNFTDFAGGIDALVHLAGGVSKPIHWSELDIESWNYDIALNLRSAFFLAQQTILQMGQQGGKVIFNSTASARHGGGGDSIAYGAAKAAIECITKGLAKAGAQNNILVNAVAPGFIRTKFHTDTMKRSEKDLLARAEMVPLKRAGKPEDVAALISYLLSDHGDFITGQCIDVSGGDFL